MKSVLLLSGGLDSTVALAMHSNPSDVTALTIDYGQRNRQREITAAIKIAQHYNCRQHTVIRVDPILFAGSALTSDGALPDQPATAPDATYVPARNTVLLALAAARAESIGAKQIIIGANADDAAGYPDCRADYLEAFRDVLQAGTVGHVWVSAPLLDTRKAEILQIARQLDVPIGLTWSCYEGLAAGPCGRCGACKLREEH